MKTHGFFGILGACGLLAGAHPAQVGYDGFHLEYTQAERVNDQRLMEGAVRRTPEHAVTFFTRLAGSWAQGKNPEILQRMERFKDVFFGAYESKLPQHIENFYAGLDSTGQRNLFRLQSAFEGLWRLREEAISSGEASKFKGAIGRATDVAKELEELGQLLLAAEAYNVAADLLGQMPGRALEDQRRAVELLEKYKELREAWDWTKDHHYIRTINFLEAERRRLEAAAADREAAAEAEAEAAGPRFREGSTWGRVPLTFQPAPQDYEGLSMWASSYPMAWLGANVQGDEPFHFNFFKDGDLFLHRTGAARFLVSDSRSADGGEEVRIRGRPTFSVFHYRKGDRKVPFAMWFWHGSQQETHQRLPFNVQPTWSGADRRALIFYRGGASYIGTVEGTRLTFHDENASGSLGDELTVGDMRLSTGPSSTSHAAMDSMTVGTSQNRVPFSSYVKLGRDWYRIRINNNNEEIAYRPLDPDSYGTGTLEVKWNGPRPLQPRHLIVREVRGFRGAFFDAMSSPRGIEVPAGTYEIHYGRIITGRGATAKYALVLQGSSRPFQVEPGKTTTLELGAPFHIEFELSREGEEMTVDATTAWVRGRAGEKYCYLLDEVLEPEVVVAREADGRGQVRTVGEFRRIGSSDEVRNAADSRDGLGPLHAAFYPVAAGGSLAAPRFTVTFANPFPGGGTVYTALRQRGHKMFGDLQPVWK